MPNPWDVGWAWTEGRRSGSRRWPPRAPGLAWSLGKQDQQVTRQPARRTRPRASLVATDPPAQRRQRAVLSPTTCAASPRRSGCSPRQVRLGARSRTTTRLRDDIDRPARRGRRSGSSRPSASAPVATVPRADGGSPLRAENHLYGAGDLDDTSACCSSPTACAGRGRPCMRPGCPRSDDIALRRAGGRHPGQRPRPSRRPIRRRARLVSACAACSTGGGSLAVLGVRRARRRRARAARARVRLATAVSDCPARPPCAHSADAAK